MLTDDLYDQFLKEYRGCVADRVEQLENLIARGRLDDAQSFLDSEKGYFKCLRNQDTPYPDLRERMLALAI